jgi:hypothetical protein
VISFVLSDVEQGRQGIGGVAVEPSPGVLVVLGLLASLVPGVLGCCILGW